MVSAQSGSLVFVWKEFPLSTLFIEIITLGFGMEMLISIFKQLGIDKTLFYQLAVAISAYYLCKVFFLEKLKAILIHRENNTSTLLRESISRFEKSENMAKEYNSKINEAYEKARREKSNRKSKIVSEYADVLKAEENKLKDLFQADMEKADLEFKDQEQVMAKRERDLTQLLVNKVTMTEGQA